jgi:asparagine synthase (glutamine-hydrolysing)
LYLDDISHRDHIYLNSAVFRTYLKRDFIEDFSEKQFCGSLLRNRMMNEMFEEIVPAILHEDDLNSMLYSIENRSPYLDSRLFEYSCSIPNEHLIKDGYAKYILRSAVRGVLNEQVRTDRCKKGFNASMFSLVDFQQPENRDSMLADGPIFDYIRRDAVASLMDAPFLQNSMSKFLFNCASVRCFLDLNA